GKPSESAADNCVDLGVVNSPDIKPAETLSVTPSPFADVGVALQFASWFSAFVQGTLIDSRASFTPPAALVLPADLYFARSVILLV
ncbi:MAG: hypothetical protein V4671_19165, partial [Armatimonadota bacterium]